MPTRCTGRERPASEGAPPSNRWIRPSTDPIKPEAEKSKLTGPLLRCSLWRVCPEGPTLNVAGGLPLVLLTARTQRLMSSSTAGLDLDAARLIHVGPSARHQSGHA